LISLIPLGVEIASGLAIGNTSRESAAREKEAVNEANSLSAFYHVV